MPEKDKKIEITGHVLFLKEAWKEKEKIITGHILFWKQAWKKYSRPFIFFKRSLKKKKKKKQATLCQYFILSWPVLQFVPKCTANSIVISFGYKREFSGRVLGMGNAHYTLLWNARLG